MRCSGLSHSHSNNTEIQPGLRFFLKFIYDGTNIFKYIRRKFELQGIHERRNWQQNKKSDLSAQLDHLQSSLACILSIITSVPVDNEARAELLGVTSMQICNMSESQNIEATGAHAIGLEANKGTALKTADNLPS